MSQSVRMDTAKQKRVELHLHTKMSAMGGLTDMGKAIERAVRWGHKAIAITDHAVVHSFPDAERAAAGKIKIIYGVEAYMCLDEKGRKSPYHMTILAQNPIGLKNLYCLVSESHLNYFCRWPLMPHDLLDRYRSGLLFGSGCAAGELFQAILKNKPQEDLERIASWYDYLEIQPLSNNAFLTRPDRDSHHAPLSEENLRDFNRRVVELGELLHKPVCATGDVHFLDPQDEICHHILLDAQGFGNADDPDPLYFRTTDEMLEEFSYLGEKKAWEVVVDNTNLVAGKIQTFPLLPQGLRLPKLEGSQELSKTIWGKAHDLYGKNLPAIVEDRIQAELEMITKNGYDVIFDAARHMVADSIEHGYPVGFRGGVGSSLVAFLAGITQVNPLPAHYRCPKCCHSDFSTGTCAECGADLPHAICPDCGTPYQKDGFNIPMEPFFGCRGEKVPDIDLCVAEEYWSPAIEKVCTLIGTENVFRMGTLSTVGKNSAYSYVCKYAKKRGLDLTEKEKQRLSAGCIGVKRSTGHHPGGLVIVPQDMDICDFTPVQNPAGDTNSEVVATHLDYPALANSLYRLDIMGRDDYSMLHMLQKLTGVDAKTISLDDQATMDSFTAGETIAVPEFGSPIGREFLQIVKPTRFSELVRIHGSMHGAGVWNENGKDLFQSGVASLEQIIAFREDILLSLREHGVGREKAYAIMKAVRSGQVKECGLLEDWADAMKEAGLPEWYTDSMAKIEWLFPKAHCVIYTMQAFRIAWFKVHNPLAFYAAWFSTWERDFDAAIMFHGRKKAESHLLQIKERIAMGVGTWRDEDIAATLEVVCEFYQRGFSFSNISVLRSDAENFLIETEKNCLLPPLTAVSGVSSMAAQSVLEQRTKNTFTSIAQLVQSCPQLTSRHIKALRAAGAFENLPEK